MANAVHVLSDAVAMTAEMYDLDPVSQENRFGETAKFITKSTKWQGGYKLHKKFLTQQYTGATSSADIESDAPASTKIKAVDIYIQESNLRKVGATLARGLPASMELDGGDMSIFNIANELISQMFENFGEKRNQMLQTNSVGAMGTVAAKYKHDGDTYPAANDAVCFLKITGSISMFHPGMLLDVRNGTTETTPRGTVTVNDVWHDEIMFGRNVGPGITVTWTTDGATTTEKCDDITAADTLAITTETTGGYEASFASLCNFGASPSAYFSLARTTQGNRYLIPYGRDYSTTNLDLDVHFGHMITTFGRLLSSSREYRKNAQFALTRALLCQAQPNLVNEIARQAGAGNTFFTRSIASSEDAAKGPLTAIAGWDGVVIHSPTLNVPIVVSSEPLMPAGKIRVWDPNAWEWIRFGTGKPTWIPNDAGGVWHSVKDPTTGALKMQVQASGYVIDCPFCDQPKMVYEMQGLTDTIS